MNYPQINNLIPSRVVMGCMRINSLNQQEVETLIASAISNNINFFDHADIYAGGECETLFGKALSNAKSLRDQIIIQSKCGIRPDLGTFDFSKEHILNSVNGILKRLQIDQLDILLLHRPDTLVEPDEVAAAFDQLEQQGKVKHFGVSNQSPSQIKLLQNSLQQPLLFNQLQLSLAFTPMIDRGLNLNMTNKASQDHDGDILDFSRLQNMIIQTWSPFQFGFMEGVFIGHEDFPELNACLEEIGKQHNVSPTTVATAWLLRHPAKMQVIAGTTKANRLKEIAQAMRLELSREEWYTLYRSAGNKLP